MAIKDIFQKKKWKSEFESGQAALADSNFADAEKHLESAYARVQSMSEEDVSLGDTALLLGQVLRRLEKLERSVQVTVDAFQAYRRVLPAGDPRVVNAHLSLVLAGSPEAMGEDKALCISTYRTALEQFSETSWQSLRCFAMVLPHLDSDQRERGVARGQRAVRHVLGKGRSELGLWPAVAWEVAGALRALDLPEESTEAAGWQVGLDLERHGERSGELAQSRLRYAELLFEVGRYGEAYEQYRASAERIRALDGQGGQRLFEALSGCGLALLRQGRLIEAAEPLQQAREALKAAPEQARSVRTLEVLLGLLEYRCLQDAQDAERSALWREVDQFWEMESDDELRKSVWRGLLAAQQRLQQGWEIGRAYQFLSAVLKRVRDWRGANHPDVARVLMEAAYCALLLDDEPKALAHAQQSLTIDESLSNQLRGLRFYGRVGDRARCTAIVELLDRQLRGIGDGAELARARTEYAWGLLESGRPEQAYEVAEQARTKLPVEQRGELYLCQVEALVALGRLVEAERSATRALQVLVDPYLRGRTYLLVAWLSARAGAYPAMRESLAEVERIREVREDHPLLLYAAALSAQGSLCAGDSYAGLEARNQVLETLRNGRHLKSRKALDLLLLMEPYRPEDAELQLEIGEALLGGSRYPQRAISGLHCRDVASVGLRDLVYALAELGQSELAKKRLQELKARLSEYEDPRSPWWARYHLCAARLSETSSARAQAIQQGLVLLRRQHPQHRDIFDTLEALGDEFVELGDKPKAKGTYNAAFELKPHPRIRQKLEALERPQSSFPTHETSPAAAEAIATPVEVASEASPAEAEPPEETVPAEALVATNEVVELTHLPLVSRLLEEGRPPTPEERRQLKSEVKARFGEDPRALVETYVTLALLYPRGDAEGRKLWARALEELPGEDEQALRLLQARAEDAGDPSLAADALEARCRSVSRKLGDNATELVPLLAELAGCRERTGDFKAAYRAWDSAREILDSWFGAKSLRLRDSLTQMRRLAENLRRYEEALALQTRVLELLEQNGSAPEELFRARIDRLPLLVQAAQITELLSEVERCDVEVEPLTDDCRVEYGAVLFTAAGRLDRDHWHVEAATKLLKIALGLVPSSERALRSRLSLLYAECQARRDYLSQADKLRQEALVEIDRLESESRAELRHWMAVSCLRTQHVDQARGLAEELLEERIAEYGRKDVWAGRALLVLAEADLLSYRLEGTETAIAMTRAALEQSPYWREAELLLLQALFLLGREEEANALLDRQQGFRGAALQLDTAVWRGRTQPVVQELLENGSEGIFSELWRNLETVPMATAVSLLEMLGRAGQFRLLSEGYERMRERAKNLLAVDPRCARWQRLTAFLAYWNGSLDQAEEILHRASENLSRSEIRLPFGLAGLEVSRLLCRTQRALGRGSAALEQARLAQAQAAEIMGEEDPRTLLLRIESALCYLELGDSSTAFLKLERILIPLQSAFGEGHSSLAELFRASGRVLEAQGDLEAARTALLEAQRIDRATRGDSLNLAEDHRLLAGLAHTLEEALQELDRAQEIASKCLPIEHRYSDRLGLERASLQEHFEARERRAQEAAEAAARAAREDEERRAQEAAEAAARAAREEEERRAQEAAEAAARAAREEEERRAQEAAETAARAAREEEERRAQEAAEAAPGEASPVKKPRRRGAKLSPPEPTPDPLRRQGDFPTTPLREPSLQELVQRETRALAEEVLEPTGLTEPTESAESRETEPMMADLPEREAVLNLYDPESFLLPLAPLFFLPFPWKEATEPALPKEYEPIYQRFQDQLREGEDWRATVMESVGQVRTDPCPSGGYLLLLIGMQLERLAELDLADLCLSTATELLVSPNIFGAAAHLAGRVAGRRGELTRAMEYLERALPGSQQAEWAVLKVDLAECEVALGRPEDALLSFEDVFDYLAGNAPKLQALTVQAKMAQIHLLVGDPQASEALCEETEKRLGSRTNGTYRVLCRTLLSRAFASLGKYDRALALAEGAWSGAANWSNKRKEGRRLALSNLSDLYCLSGRLDEAVTLLHDSGFLDDGLGEAELLLRAGFASCLTGRTERADAYLKLGRAVLGRFRSPSLWRSAFFELEAELLLRAGRPKEAREASRRALTLFEEESTGPVDRSRYLVRAARIAAAEHRLEEAQRLLDDAFALRNSYLGAQHPHTESVEGLAAVISAG